MEPWTYREVFCSNETLKDLREKHDLNIPEWYVISSKRLLDAVSICFFIIGAFFGFGIGKFI